MNSKKPWSAEDIPSQQGKLALVTGASGGIGYETALALAANEADVIIAARNRDKGQAAVQRIKQAVPGASVRFERVDLASLASVRQLADRLLASGRPLDLLINNAGVMTPPKRLQTEDGFEQQFGTNYLSHFVLTGRLLPLLQRASAPRVVTLSSVAARSAVINFDDLQAERTYKPMVVYGQSKLACLMFAFELQRRSDAGGWGISSLGAHPGIARTELLHNGPGRLSGPGLMRTFLWFLFQPTADGALPTLFAATSPSAKAGGYYGPQRLSETRGAPGPAVPPARALDAQAARRLWEISEKIGNITFSPVPVM